MDGVLAISLERPRLTKIYRLLFEETHAKR